MSLRRTTSIGGGSSSLVSIQLIETILLAMRFDVRCIRTSRIQDETVLHTQHYKEYVLNKNDLTLWIPSSSMNLLCLG